MSLKQVLDKFSGKLIYVDFWSSGCGPCIKEFQFSRKLKDSYKGKDLVQVYISVESDENKWMKACERYNLKSESYFLKNRYTSKEFEKMNIKYLPHYLIYNKKGTLVIEIAPKPSDKNLIKLFDKYLNE